MYKTELENMVRTVGLSYDNVDNVDVIEKAEPFSRFIRRASHKLACRYEAFGHFQRIPVFVQD